MELSQLRGFIADRTYSPYIIMYGFTDLFIVVLHTNIKMLVRPTHHKFENCFN